MFFSVLERIWLLILDNPGTITFQKLAFSFNISKEILACIFADKLEINCQNMASADVIHRGSEQNLFGDGKSIMDARIMLEKLGNVVFFLILMFVVFFWNLFFFPNKSAKL